MAHKERAAPVAPGERPQIEVLGTERYAPQAEGNQAPDFDGFIRQLEVMARWAEDITRRLDPRQAYFLNVNAWGGHDDLELEIRDFNKAVLGLVASYAKRRSAA